ncbi:MAG: arginase [Bacilli bacterium]
MKNKVIIKAKTDLGVHIDGANLGPDKIYSNGNELSIEKDKTIKEKNSNNLRKNEKAINAFNINLYNCVTSVLKNNKMPIIIGGDHSLSIGSALAVNDYYNGVGVIWFDSHGDFNTFKTTRSGNIHGLPLATISGYENQELREFAKGFVNPKNVVIIGARSIDKWEIGNLTDAGVTIFTTNDVITKGVETVVKLAIEIAGKNTNGIHVSYDIDMIDPFDAPGVSIAEVNGISKADALKMVDYLYDSKIKSFDLVEYNPLKDIDDKTLKIAKEILDKIKKNL